MRDWGVAFGGRWQLRARYRHRRRRESIVYLYYEKDGGDWKSGILVGTGLPQAGDSPFQGSGSVAVGAVHDDTVGCVATCEVPRQRRLGVHQG
ncbi:hypothetical protein BD414DRAFT_488922 [Trametes punicea]|nr:hypothetical protein BD414DRAFT_488922 [Trametes punicea]